MEQYIVSARKYRPDSFESLIGQDNIVQTLKNSIIRGQLAHAYLFCGPRGVGKTSAARIFAKIINCSNPTGDMDPCGHCESCISFQEGRSYCIHELDAASNNGVDDIKNLIDQVNIPPQVGRYSVYIVDEVHMLSASAFNAFLKTLEDPPAHAIFILATTEKHKILPTILSRCQTYDFNRISVPDIVRNLRGIAAKEKITIEEEALHTIARKADGAMRDALTIFDQTVAFCGTDIRDEEVRKHLNVLDYEHTFRMTEFFLEGNYPEALLRFDEILAKGFNALHFVAALSSHFRDLMVAKSRGLDGLMELPDSLKEKYRAQAERCSLKFLYEALGITTQCEAGYRASINARLHIEFTLMKLCFLGAGEVKVPETPVEALAKAQAVKPEEPAAPAEAPVKAKTETKTKAGKEAPVKAPANKAEVPEEAEENTKNASAEVSANADVPVNEKGEKPATEAPVRQQPKKKALRMAASLSINSIKEQNSGDTSAPLPSANAAESPIPEDALILECWKKLPAEYESRPRLATTLSSAKVEIEEKDGVKHLTFFVINTAQQQWIEEKLMYILEGQLQKLVQSSRLKLHVAVIPDEHVEEKPYLPKEQAIELMASNPEIKNFVTDFDLDTKM